MFVDLNGYKRADGCPHPTVSVSVTSDCKACEKECDFSLNLWFPTVTALIHFRACDFVCEYDVPCCVIYSSVNLCSSVSLSPLALIMPLSLSRCLQ